MRVKLTILDRNPPASVRLSKASPTAPTSLSMEVALRNYRTTLGYSLSEGEVQTILKLYSLPQHPFSGRDVTLVTERERERVLQYVK